MNFYTEKRRLANGLSKRQSDFGYIGCYVRDVQDFIKSYEPYFINDSKTLENLFKFCDTVWDEGFNDVDGWDLSIDEIRERVQRLERSPI